MAVTDLGRVCPVIKGPFALGANYTKLDIVTNAGSSYIAKLDNVNIALSNTTYWAILAQAGDFAGTATAVCGQNLFHNWDFRTPVNQRAVSGAISTAGYFYDRWMLVSGTVTVGGGSVTLSNTTMSQRIEGHDLAGKEVTVSVLIGGTVYSGTGTFPSSAGTASIAMTGITTAVLTYHTDYMAVNLYAATSCILTAVKLELGAYSTLGRQPPMDWAVELPKCQRFFVVLNRILAFYGYFSSATLAYGLIPLPVSMRTNPTLSHTDVFMRGNGGSGYSGKVSSVALGGAHLRLNIAGTGFPIGEAMVGRIGDATPGVVYSLSSDL